MLMTRLRSIALVSMLLAHGCGEATPEGDAGTDAGRMDASSPHDAGTDAGGGCTPVTVGSWSLALMDDVSIRYRARIVPDVGGEPWDLYLEFIRYDVPYVGEFTLGSGMDANYGGCAHCVVAWYGTALDHAFFARSGTLLVRDDPFSQHLDATLRDVVLEEVTIGGEALESTPVPGGICLALAETVVMETFPSAGWTCPTEHFDDGETCHCGCGAHDPDCGYQCSLPPDPGCDPTPLPIANCNEGDLCTWEGVCAAACDHADRTACDAGICAFSHDGDRCFLEADPLLDDAAIGETCEDFALYCAVDAEGFAMGLCDADADWLCRPTCESEDDCTVEGDTCWTLFVDPATGVGQGYCRPAPPPCVPSGETCGAHLDCCSVLCEGLGGDRDGGLSGTCG
jgi:hypothetical protein